MPHDLHAAWRQLVREAGADPDNAESAFADLCAAYGAPERSYHNLDHVWHVLATVERLRDEARDFVAVRLAAWFHDVVYDARAGDNEERSADWAARALAALGVPAAVVAETRRLILLSKTHQPEQADADGCAFTDADLAILGSEEAEYRSYARAIRREYAWVANDAYRTGRGRVLRAFLARPRIYRTRPLFEELEGRARRNVETELQELALMGPSTAYPPRIAALLAEDRLNPLGAGIPDATRLRALTVEELFAPLTIRDRDMAAACVAGLWLRCDCFEESHRLSQEIETPNGSYWHAILHRREPDPSNAAYWFRKVGDHPLFETLGKSAQELGLRLPSDHWDPFAFIDLCEKHRGTGSEHEMLLRQVQRREWELLFDWCFQRATT